MSALILLKLIFHYQRMLSPQLIAQLHEAIPIISRHSLIIALSFILRFS